MKNILIALDFDKTDFLIKKTIELLDCESAKIWLLHAAAPDPDFVGYEVGPQYVRDLRAEELREEHKTLLDRANEIKKGGIDAEGLLIQGATVETILAESEKLEVDVIVIDHGDHSFLYNLIFGETSVQVVKDTKIPVMVVPLN